MSEKSWVFDHLLGTIEAIVNNNAAEILAKDKAIGDELTAPIYRGLPTCKSRSAQFALIHKSIELGETRFRERSEGLSKETLMSIVRRAPVGFLGGAELLLASLIVKYGTPDPAASQAVDYQGGHGLAIVFTEETVATACELMSIAKTMNHLCGMARWLGKGGKLTAPSGAGLVVDLPEAVRSAVDAYERRRVRDQILDDKGFFAPQKEPAKWSQYRIPNLAKFEARMIEAPLASDRWLSFERLPLMLDGGALASILHAYETPILEIYGAGVDPILHSLTALAVLIHENTPKIVLTGDNMAFAPEATPQATEHKLGFAFGLARKGFLRLPRDTLIHNFGRVRTPLAPDQATGEALARAFIDAFLMPGEAADRIDPISGGAVPFLHQSTEDHVYVDILLIHDFLRGVIDNAKGWYASQHGDRFSLDLKRWLDELAPGAVVGARVPVNLPGGGVSDIDLLARDDRGLIVIECKAYAKSRSFMIGEPRAITQRRKRLDAAMTQARRITDVFARNVTAGETEFPRDLPVRTLVCSPTVEFLLPFDGLGLEREGIPNVVTPEELLAILRGP